MNATINPTPVPSENKAALFLKLSAVMGEIGNIPKGGENSFFHYKFVTADAVADKVRDLLSQHKIAFFASIVHTELIEIRKVEKNGEIKPQPRWVVTFEFTFADGESGVEITRQWVAEADSTDDKGINKCATAAEKYFLLKTFVVTSADEPDSDAGGGAGKPATRTGTPPGATQPPKALTPTGTSSSGAQTPVGSKDVSTDTKHPAVGSIDINTLMRRAYDEKLVKGRSHFDHLITLLLNNGDIGNDMSFEQVMEAIRTHEAKRDLEKEQSS